ncbi:hypothetical protein EXIGLDRAFT_746693 [Exidia glandulosa HHB12029]|uniref:Uncharacterized protein n=1 Tax=Exidia glandulosa HHB12029 TaxID=1314781 RepID=A0A166B632_EXIGL|nr:hypothetical protein EXIGLDRAFT_746693 [Exidia glandulosa HHB12029]
MVYIPLISTRSDLGKRKGGGRGGGGISSGGSKGGTSSSGGIKSGGSSGSSSSSSSSGGSSTPSRPIGGTGSTGSSGTSGSSSTSNRQPVSIPGQAGRSSVPYGGGGGSTTIISSGAFAGRQQGGGTRQQVYGTNVYGSGYPVGGVGRGVGGAGFPFYFWPLAWGGGLGYGAGYLHNHEYGDPNNSSRPGGQQFQVTIKSPATPQLTTYHLIADHDTVQSLITSLTTNCTSISNKPLTSTQFNAQQGEPQPESVIQYYRASSVALTLEGYNNTAALLDDPAASKVAPTPLPSGIDQTFLQCLNATIGASVPLVDPNVAATTSSSPVGGALVAVPMVGSLWVVALSILLLLRNAI